MRRILISFCILFLFVPHAFTAREDPLASEIAKWKHFVETNSSTSENWTAIKESSLPVMQRAEAALKAGRRNLALHVLAAARTNLAAQKYVQEHHVNAETKLAVLEEEWKKVQPALQSPEKPKSLDQLPASARAVAEASYSEIKVYYDASLDYAKSTMPEYGFFYVGLSTGQLEFIRFLDQFKTGKAIKPLKLPGLAAQIADLEDKLLAAYKPPASIEHHPNFIRTSALIKQAHELHDAGYEYGALYRILYARQILSKITDPGQTITAEEVAKRTQEISSRLNQKETDHSIGLIFLELANEEPHNGETARAVFESIFPVYFASLKPPTAAPKKENAVATVTLVRWPYT